MLEKITAHKRIADIVTHVRAFSFPLFVILILCSCREQVKYDFPYFTPVPTVNSILVAGSKLKTQVSLAGKLDTTHLDLVENAEILIFVNDEYTETMTYSDEGIYTSSVIVEELRTYRCEVNIPGYKTLTCIDSIPKAVEISNILHIDKAGKDEEGMTYPAIRFTFENEPSEKLYFEVVIRLIEYGNEQVANLEAITDPVLLNEGLPIALFSNETITDHNYTMTLNYFTGGASSINGGPLQTNLYPLILEVRSVSSNYYHFVKQKYLYEKGRYPEFMAASTVAFPLYSNISGGYGIFAGYSAFETDTIFPGK
jgi:hypothetical protein